MVDVLKKIDAAIAVAEFSGTDYPTTPIRAEGLREARAAVAELIEAAQEAADAMPKVPERLRAALARVGGA